MQTQRPGNARTSIAIAALAATWLAGSQPVAIAQCQYELTTVVNELPNPDAAHSVRFTALNDLGQAAGVANGSVFIWTPDTGFIELDTPGEPLFFQFPTAVGMNNITGKDGIGQVVCNLRTEAPFETVQAFIYDDETWTALSSDYQYSTIARGINDLGQVCGERNTEDGGKLFRWQDGVFTDFDEPFGNSSVRAINDNGTIVGSTVVDDLLFTWEGDDVTLFDALAENSEAVFPWYLNAAGHIAGDLYLPPAPGKTTTYASRAFLQRGNELTWFSVDGFPNSQVYGLNDLDQLVLQVFFADETGAALDHFLWQNGKYARLMDLFESEPETVSFQFRTTNHHGQIAGWYQVDSEWPNSPKIFGAILTPKNRPLGDVDCNCSVDANDLAMLLGDWGPCDEVGVCPSDIVDSATFQPPGDGVVDAADLAVVLGNWGTSSAIR